ncbi:PQQ-dependent sugar dehydrogenase [Candidatus Pelagibacter bacterium]|jgi:hypothetical protein|nr:PQQ-dependent sugar dehydrogenase [Candidatus Pelagibacter bacterium]
MLSKILKLSLLILFIVVSVTLYETDRKYSDLKKELKEKKALINDQLIYINKNNASHEINIKKKIKKLEFPKYKSLEINLYNNKKKLNFYKSNNQLVRGINNFFPGSGYLDLYENKLFLISATGLIGYSNNLYGDSIIFNQINNNINDFLSLDEINKGNWFSVKDLLVVNNNIYVSFTNEQKNNCWNTSVIVAKLNFEYLKFSNFFEPKYCVKSKNNYDKEFNAHQSGGKLFKYDDDNIILTMGDYRLRKLAQDINSTFGKILKLNSKSKRYEILSLGHRNPQGLYYNLDKDYVISTEHGPHGGDEINLNLNTKIVKNFGWAISSYGEHYGGKESHENKNKYKKYPLHKSHKDYNFIEPIKYFVPSIGISQLVQIKQNKFLLSSLKDESIYTFALNEKNELTEFKRIEIGERIRDMVYDSEKKEVVLFLENTASIGILKTN